MNLNFNGTKITLSEIFLWILFRHGEKTNQLSDRGGTLTPLGRKQVWSTIWQLIEKFGQAAMEEAAIISSPVPRVIRSTNIVLAALGRDSGGFREYDKLEWGPNDAVSKDLPVICTFIEYAPALPVIAMGHNGLFENIAQRIHPKKDRYQLNPGEAFIITPTDIEVISPKVTA